MRVSKVRCLFLLLVLGLYGCSPKFSFSPHYIRLIDEFGARPFENLFAIDKSYISDIQVYVAVSSPTQYVRRWQGIDGPDFCFPGLILSLLLELPRKIDPKFEEKIAQSFKATRFKPHTYFQNQLDYCFLQQIRPPTTITINDLSFENSLQIPIFSRDKPPGIVVLPSAMFNHSPNPGKTILVFVNLYFYFSNLEDTKISKPALYICLGSA